MPNDIPEADVMTTPAAIRRDAASAHAWRYDWTALIGLIGYHLLALLAFLPWFFSWTGVVLMILGIHVFGTLGVNLCFHRLLTHRSFSCPRWLEYTLAILGICSSQESPAHWVAVHRRHHHFADEEGDPHSPTANFFWAHVGWIVLKDEDMQRDPLLQRYARDLLRDPFHAWLDQHWMAVVTISWIAFFAAGLAAGALTGMTTRDAIQFAASVLLWGVVVRTVVFWHFTWSVNSVSHLWGYRNYETKEGSRNNLLIGAIVQYGEWHNNHHADPNSAMFGHRWWEVDPVFWIIRILAALGLAKDIVVRAGHRP